MPLACVGTFRSSHGIDLKVTRLQWRRPRSARLELSVGASIRFDPVRTIGIQATLRPTSRQDRLGVPRARSAEARRRASGGCSSSLRSAISRSLLGEASIARMSTPVKVGRLSPECTLLMSGIAVAWERVLESPVSGAFSGVISSGLVFCRASDWVIMFERAR
jgi:hypothetical protein